MLLPESIFQRSVPQLVRRADRAGICLGNPRQHRRSGIYECRRIRRRAEGPTGGVEHLNEDGQAAAAVYEQLGLSYRHSCFMEQPFLHGCILRAAFALEQGDRTAIEQEMERIITQRREKQPLEYPSAGSTFKRPGRSLCFPAD